MRRPWAQSAPRAAALGRLAMPFRQAGAAPALRDDLHCAGEAGVERRLLGDVEQPQTFELTGALQRTDIERAQASSLEERHEPRLRVGVVSRQEDIER